MLLIVHDNNCVVKILNDDCAVPYDGDASIVRAMFYVVDMFPSEIICWCHSSLLNFLNKNEIISERPFGRATASVAMLANPLEIISFNPSDINYLPRELGYVDVRSPFLNINKKVRYGTWILSSAVGVIYAKTLNEFRRLSETKDFDLFLVELGFSAMKSGMFPYSDPRLISVNVVEYKQNTANLEVLFRFVRNYYTVKLFIFLIFMVSIAERRILTIKYINMLLSGKRCIKKIDLPRLYVQNDNKCITYEDTIDVIVPTVGRPHHVYDVLCDLSCQTVPPINVIIVEQVQKESELSCIREVAWNFNLKLIVITQTGACNARNIALEHASSKWVFFADDDIRLDSMTLEKTISYLNANNLGAATIASYRDGESVDVNQNSQYWNEFGSGCSIVRAFFAKAVYYNMKYEHGFGEDTDYGIQLRNMGCSIIYYNKVPIYHLKAPYGGFREPVIMPWSNDKLPPDPSPTVMKCVLDNYNKYQINGFMIMYIIKSMFSKWYNVINTKQIIKKMNSSVHYAKNL